MPTTWSPPSRDRHTSSQPATVEASSGFLQLELSNIRYVAVPVPLLNFGFFNFIADGDKFAGMIDAFGPRHFADMDQPFDSVLQFDEGSIGHHVDNFAGGT